MDSVICSKKFFRMKYVDTIILFLLIVEKSTHELSVPEKTTYPVSECVVYILHKYFINRTKISIQYSNQQSLMVSEIISQTDLPLFLNADEALKTEGIDRRIPDDVVVMLDEHTNILQFLQDSKWTATTQFLVIATNSSTSQQRMIDIFRQFWVNNVVNVLLLSADNNYVHIYTFIPFNPHDCAIDKPVLVATFTSGQITTQKELVPKQRITNLNGCTLQATVVDFPPSVVVPNQKSKNGKLIVYGVDVSILMEISNHLNFKLNLGEPRDGKAWGRMEPSPYVAVGEIFFKKIHFACGRFSCTIPRYNNLDLTAAVGCERECISWAVPAGAKKAQPAWIRLLVDGFSNNVWCFIICTLCITTATFRILSKASKTDRHLFNGNVKTIMYTFRSFLGPSPKAPKSSFLRMMFLSWSWYSLVILSAYLALIGSKLTVPFRLSNINTFEDLVESDLQIMGLPHRFKFITDGQDDPEIKAIEKRFVKADLNFEDVVEKMISERNLAYIFTSTSFLYDVMQYPKAKGLVHFMKQCGYKYYPTMVLQKNCPFTERVNSIIGALSESGIICKWRSQYVYDISQLEPTVRKLSLYRMIGSFVVLGGGLGAAFIAFIAEQVFFWCSSRKRIKKK